MVHTGTLSLGCMAMTGFYGKRDRKQCLQTIQTAFENGISLFDTADSYGFGENEILLGEAIKPFAREVRIATKIGVVRTKEHPERFSIKGTPQYVKQQCYKSLKCLGVSVIDLYYLHHVDPHTPIEETLGAMSKLVSEGLVRHVGVYEMSVNDIRRAHAVHPLKAVQAEYSCFSRTAEQELLPLCKELGIEFHACSPLCRGLLGEEITSSQHLAFDDARQSFRDFREGI